MNCSCPVGRILVHHGRFAEGLADGTLVHGRSEVKDGLVSSAFVGGRTANGGGRATGASPRADAAENGDAVVSEETRLALAADGCHSCPPKKSIEEHVAEQQRFLADELRPRRDAAQAGQGHVFFVDAAHFVFGTGEPDAVKAARPVRRGGVGKVPDEGNSLASYPTACPCSTEGGACQPV